jgi:hypothetical protein
LHALDPPHPPAGHDRGAPPPGPAEGGLLARLDALVAFAADRRGLALLPDGHLAPAEARAAAGAAGLAPRPAPAVGAGPPSDADLDALQLLRALAEAVGLLRVRGGRLEANALRPAWAKVHPGLRAGLISAAWCQQVTLTG